MASDLSFTGRLGPKEYFELTGKVRLFEGSLDETLESMEEYVHSLSFPEIRSPWSHYYDTEKPSPPEALAPVKLQPDPTLNRNEIVRRFIEKLKPRTLIDLGSNAGLFSYYAESQGTTVLSIDNDMACIDAMHLYAQKSMYTKKITLCFGDVTKTNGNKAECVLALALTHHLHLGQHYKWEFIARTIASYSSSCALIEFMMDGLGSQGNPRPSPLAQTYKIEYLLEHLKPFFFFNRNRQPL